MKKIIRLTERDLTNLVKRVIKEQEKSFWDWSDDERESLKGADGKFDVDKFDEVINKKSSTRTLPSKRKAEKGPFAYQPDSKKWYDAEDYEVDEPGNFSDEKTFGPGEYDDFMEYINNCNTKWCLTTKRFYDEYAKRGGIKVRK